MKLHQFMERKGEKAHKEAIAMGLQYKGFGYWVDPNTGQVTHKTENDKLVPVEPDVEGDLYKDAPGSGTPDGAGGGPKMSVPGGMTIGSGQGIMGAPMPGEELAPREDGWEAGPDGDTCVDGKKPGKIPKDVFVGKSNYLNWVAGPDGSTNGKGSYDRVQEVLELGQLRQILEDDQQNLALTDAGYQEPQPTNRARERMKKVFGQGSAVQNRTDVDAQSAINALRQDHPTVLGNQIAAMRKIANRDADRSYDSAPKDLSGKERVERNKEMDMWKQLAKLPAVRRDADAVKQMNAEVQNLVSDPKFDLDQYDDDDFEDGGAFGQIVIGNDHVVKKGEIGPDEMKALYAMKDNKAFPTLINGRFDGPFKHKSSTYNNPMGADNEARDPGQSGYWNPDEQSDFDRKFPVAPGTYAMSRAKGRPLADAIYDMDDEQKEEMMRNFWRARGDLHKAGFSHNDMHGGNIFVDDDGQVSIIDLGLAKGDKLSALMEAMGGMDYENAEDYQLADGVSGGRLPDRLRDTFTRNLGNVEERILDSINNDPSSYEDYQADSDYSPTFTGIQDTLQSLMRGGIRLDQETLDHIKTDLPFLQDEGNIDQLMSMLYDEVGQSELADRMSDAFSRRQQDSAVIRAANRLRKERGEKEIDVTNPNVVPPKNLIFDD